MNIPQELLKEAVAASGAASQTMAVVLGLQELIRKKYLRELSELRGSGALKVKPQARKTSRSR